MGAFTAVSGSIKDVITALCPGLSIILHHLYSITVIRLQHVLQCVASVCVAHQTIMLYCVKQISKNIKVDIVVVYFFNLTS